MVYNPYEIELDAWLKDCGYHYERIAVHADDSLMSSKDPQGAIDALTRNHHFKLKGTGSMSYHL